MNIKEIKTFFVKDCWEYEYHRFYLPVKRYPDRFWTQQWIFPLALFVMIYLIIYNIIRRIWIDLREFLYLLTQKNEH